MHVNQKNLNLRLSVAKFVLYLQNDEKKKVSLRKYLPEQAKRNENYFLIRSSTILLPHIRK
jgi:hypothetical protein